ncbi:MAG: glycosyltransferase [Patescibacteria group bacterium]|jgi:glycosyltransferase involved in cell wall biosynthesis
MKPFFSVIISTLNEEKCLPILLEDLNKQKTKDFELIVVDGGSSDKTVSVANKNKNNFIKYKLIKSDKQNLSYQRNLGAQKSAGRFLIFLDADIRIKTDYLSTIKKVIEKKSFLFLTTYQYDDSDNLNKFLVQVTNYSLELLKLIGKQMAPGYNFIILKEVFERLGGFNEKTTMSEDHDLSIRIQQAGVKINIIPKQLLKWSFRRIKKDGYIPILFKYGIATFHSLVLGEITDKKLGYQMGGQYFIAEEEVKSNKKIQKEIKKYYSKITKAFNKIF